VPIGRPEPEPKSKRIIFLYTVLGVQSQGKAINVNHAMTKAESVKLIQDIYSTTLVGLDCISILNLPVLTLSHLQTWI
jgi:hypothetical protein